MDANKYNAWNVIHLWNSDGGVFRRGIGPCPFGQKKISHDHIGTWFDLFVKVLVFRQNMAPL